MIFKRDFSQDFNKEEKSHSLKIFVKQLFLGVLLVIEGNISFRCFSG